MRKGKLWGRLLSATSLSLSIFLGSFGNVTGVQAMESNSTVLVEEIKASEDASAEASSEDSVTEAATDSSLDDSAAEESTVIIDEEVAEAATIATTDETDETNVTAELETEEYTVTLADAPNANLAPREQKAADNSLVTRENVHDGAILHAFCWSFNTIAENMADIADAGYTAVQTSPINECLATNPGMNLHGPDGMWYYHYQPTDWVIGNYQLGSRDEFKHMCDVADEYGIAIIVDILPNHTTPSSNQIAAALKEAAGGSDALYHATGKIGGGYTDRLELTYYSMGGLPDVDTENTGFQQYFYEFLKDCVYLGADGFRIDTAKHISLPDDPVPSDYSDAGRNTFYPNMRQALNEYSAEVGTKSYDELFVYGEVLQGTNDRLAAYQQYIGGTTASNYGSSLRSALSSGNLSVDRLLDYQIYDDTAFGTTYTADTEKLVTWVESHDNYMNDSESCWKSIDDDMIIMGWSIIAARDAGTPLFFSRPNNSSSENPYGDNLIGEAGSPIYKAPEVKAVNLFREKMGEANEYLSNPNGVQTLMIERYDDSVEGAVIVNAAQTRTTINAETHLSDGIYPDQVEGSDAVFLVKDGVISGTVAGEGVAVLSERIDGTGTVVSFYNHQNWNSVVARVDNAEATLSTINENDGWFQVTVLDDEFTIRFESADGSQVSPEYAITAGSGTFVTPDSNELFYSKAAAEESLGINTYSVYFFNTENWDTVYAYGWLDGGEQIFGGWPGTPAVNEGSGWWRADVKTYAKLPVFNIIFNNGAGTQTVNIEGFTPATEDIYCTVDAESSNGQLVVKRFTSKETAEKALGVSGSFTTAYFYNTEGWDKVCVYTWGGTAMGEWPGKELTQDEDGWYSVVLPAGPSEDLNIIFNNGNNGKQTNDMKISDMKYRFILNNGIAYQKYGSKKEAMAAIAGAEEVTYTTVSYYNEMADDANWKNVYLYVFGGNNGEYNNLVGTWPGKLMEKEEGTNWVTAEVPTKALETGTLTYIFNNGNGTQLDDNKNITSDKNFFTYSSRDSFASKDEVYAFLGISTDEPQEPEEGTLTKKYGRYYLIDENGDKLKGFHKVEGILRFFDENGVMAINKWVTRGDDRLRALGDGRIAKDEMVTIYGADYYFGTDEALVTASVFDYDGNKYYAKADGKISKSGLLTIGDDIYISLSDGKLARSIKMEKYFSEYILGDDCKAIKGITTYEGQKYYCKDNGRVAKDAMFTIDGDTYYAKKDGTLAVSETITRYGKKYTFDENGKLIK
ncbi:MAG: starch-binding protein [Butyrivibrio sp.]|uniref:starch-binding protein n=1 Tax=Butyrivibrio sp. TaxID=28121 RepID=UPI0025C3DA0C|nr:starch-binding protein [Butyrivibrio sp.]MBQ6589258.1 starch-binding protein [Butyrivibrio sp.]